jgi:hypothetical protein
MTDEINILDDSEYIIIPNPIYDVVFRYLMEDPESAMIVLSTLIDEKITYLRLEPQTHARKNESEATITDPKSKKDIHLFHLDFVATIELPDGSEEMIMIELQKASEPDDIFRFKRYISENFQKKYEKEILHPVSHTVEMVTKPIRLIPIFILNFRIENEINDLLIRTNRIKTGVFKNKPLQKTNEFIDNLSYDILVVQLPNIHNIIESEYTGNEYKKKLFALLKLFDQKSKVKDNEHRLRLISRFFPGFLDRVIRRLQAADINNPVMEKQMFAEDEYLKALIKRDNRITWLEEGIETRDKTIEEKEKTIEEKEKAIEEKDKALNETRRIIFDLAKTLKDSGFTVDLIIQKTGLSVEEIENL